MAEAKGRQVTVSSKRLDERKALRFLEELSWILDRYSDVDFRGLVKFFEKETHRSNSNYDELSGFNSKNSNKNFLVGLLPGMFTDEVLFPNNEDIAEFAETALNVKIPRWEKKSKFELIGHIVCNTAAADDEKMARIARALRSIAGSNPQMKTMMAKERREKKTWNEIIQKIIDRS